MSKERPILMNGEMVRAVLDGGKTQTRRVVKHIINTTLGDCIKDVDGLLSRLDIAPKNWEVCPYGHPGDRLWVRETWRIGAWSEDDGEVAIDYMADKHSRREWLQVPDADDFEKYWLQCCDDCEKAGVKTDEEGKYHWEAGQSPCRIRPSIFMPRWASRIALEITTVRVERLQDISDEDAKYEGLKGITKDGKLVKYGIPDRDGYPGTDNTGWPWEEWRVNPVKAYRKLWESINGPGSWDANPWVWVIEFKQIDPKGIDHEKP